MQSQNNSKWRAFWAPIFTFWAPIFAKWFSYWRAASTEIKNIRSLVGCGLLSALGIVLKIFTLALTQTLRIGFSFISIAMGGFLYGPLWGGAVGVIIDILGYLLNPTGPYSPGFTFNAFLNGFICGLWLWRRPVCLWRVIAACSNCILLVNLVINPYWLYLLYGGSYIGNMIARIPTNAIMLPTYILLVYFLTKAMERQMPRRAPGRQTKYLQ